MEYSWGEVTKVFKIRREAQECLLRHRHQNPLHTLTTFAHPSFAVNFVTFCDLAQQQWSIAGDSLFDCKVHCGRLPARSSQNLDHTHDCSRQAVSVSCCTVQPSRSLWPLYRMAGAGTEEPLIKDHPDKRLLWWKTTLIKDHSDYGPLWLKTTLIKDHSDYGPLWLWTTLIKDHSDYGPLWLKTTLIMDHSD